MTVAQPDPSGIHWTGCHTIHPACADIETERARTIEAWANDTRDYEET